MDVVWGVGNRGAAEIVQSGVLGEALPAASGLAEFRADPLGPMTRGFKARLTPYKLPAAYLLC